MRVLISVFVLTLLFLSCSKEDAPEVLEPISLVGSRWVSFSFKGSNQDYYNNIEFINDTELAIYTTASFNVVTDPGKVIYKYTIAKENESVVHINLTIDGDNITALFNRTPTNKKPYIYFKDSSFEKY